MKKEQQIKEILTAIRKACPELMELSFGCEVKFDENTYRRYYCLGKTEDFYHYLMDKGDPERCNHVVCEREGWNPKKIIGHEPHLEHLLRAIDMEHKGNYFIDTEGWLVRNNRLLGEQLRKIKIDLTLSLRQNLENKDLREFIHSLLKV